jgi:peptidoglycan hydrolase-like protein with peptidoglycan-binding domain
MSDRDMVNMFIDEASSEQFSEIANNHDLSVSNVKEIQAGLNLLSDFFPDDKALALDIDGVFGPKTYSRFKQFYTSLPLSTQKRLHPKDNPVVNVDGRVI